MTRLQIRRWVVPAALLVLVALHNVAMVQRQPAAELAIQMRVSSSARVKAYFDTGSGFNERQSIAQTIVTTPIAQHLFLPVPTGTIRSIRLDPFEATGTIEISNATIERPRTHVLLRRFDLSKIIPGDKIASLVVRDGAVEATATEPLTHAQFTLPCDPPLTISYTARQIFSNRFFRINAIWLLFGTFLFLADRLRNRWWPRASRPLLAIDRVFAAWSRRFAFSTVLPLDRTALWYYALCFAIFATMAAAGLHGSSIRLYGWMYAYSPVRHLPLLGKPKGTRVDEWNYHTPTILNQILRRDHFAADSSLFGPDKAALFANVPTRHWSEWFRPQFWVFHCLPPAAAYACYWQTKGLLLLTGTFSLLLLLTRSSFAATLGALWYFFSPYTQWCYSWPSLLPEMVGLFGWVICLGAYLTIGRSRWRLTLAALFCALFTVDFALCAYPPHQFPLVIFGLALAAWWLWTHWDLIISKHAWRPRILVVGACWLSIAVVMGLFYLDVRIGFGELARTIYPGQRTVGGGTLTVAQMLSHFMDFWKSERSFPPELGNICEATGFLWLAPATLLLPSHSQTRRHTRSANLFLWLAFLLLAAWMLVPIPAAVGKLFFLDKVIPHRCLPTLGLINIAIVVMYVGSMRLKQARPGLTLWRNKLLPYFGTFILLLGAFAYMNSVYHHFFSFLELSTAAAYAAFLVSCLRNGWRRLLAAGLLLPAAATTALVNPVDRGFDVILKSSLSILIKQQPELKNSRWLVFSSWVYLPGFFSACGLDLVNGLKIIPALDELSRFDPAGKYASVTNQSCYLVTHVRTDMGPSEFESPSTGVLVWKVSPLDPKLKEIGIKYVAFDSQPDPSIRQKLKLIFKEESGGIWAYELP